MNRHLKKSLLALLAVASAFTGKDAAAQYAVEVGSYDSGTNPASEFGSGLVFDITSSALGEPSRFTADPGFPSVVSPFSSPYKRSQLLSVGETGHVTLRLSNYTLPQIGGNEIGVFAHTNLYDNAWPAGIAGPPENAFGVDRAVVELSAEGMSWVSLGEVVFANPTNGYADITDPYSSLPGSVPSDFQLPFADTIDSFTGLKHFDAGAPDILDLLAGSGGGTWLDIPVGLAQVGFVRFSVPDNAAANVNFELDAVSISRAAMGAPTVPEPTSLALLLTIVAAAMLTSRRSVA